MSVYIYWQSRRWAIKCPNCGNCNKLQARKDLTLFCGKCQKPSKMFRKKVRFPMEEIYWVMRKEKKK